MKTKLVFLGIFFALKSFSQSDFNLGFLPKIVVSKKTSENSKWVNSIESRTIIYDEEYQLTHNLVDISSIISFKTSLNQSFNFGYILRFRNLETIHRTFQHYNFVYQFSSLKMAQRVALEQFYQTNKQTTFRTRYGVTLEKPLNGEKVDENEFYIKVGNEYLTNFSDLEIRFTPYLGYKASKKDKIEAGFDYRINDFITSNTKNNLWFRVTWYVSF